MMTTNNDQDIDPQLNYSPKLFIRCHCRKNDPFDNSTNIWSATFIAKITEFEDNRFVATCGANMVCIIDCKKSIENNEKSVIARYIDDNVNEDFVSLACTSVSVKNKEEVMVLAVGGKKHILLVTNFHGFHCYEKFDSHSDQINSLNFISSDILFSASYDKTIKMWRISSPENTKRSHLLTTIDINDNLLSLCYSHKYQLLLASGFKGLYFWSNSTDLSLLKNCQPKSMVTQLKTKYLIDGLTSIPIYDDIIAIRIYLSKMITIIDLKRVTQEINKNDKSGKDMKTITLSKITKAKLKSFDGYYPYIYLSAQKDLLVSGGPNGQIWIYKTNRLKEYCEANELIRADRVIEWPAIENIIKDNKCIIDDKKPVIINTCVISGDLHYLIGCTQMNLVCIWHKT
ncbi:leucine-rich repeat and WD repeat-containing protein 1-like [Oppia nitens]|uniref:leucine-rich repeat and WD repeat-containing protein 1-like n=1 Tax=Oppia nitens TaxID=1686743 RepID=UPI0023DB3E27|nr:leucine-rich repeat and WD repeat-containing protein 1-like [Oppia nitens]